jgi:hypothetical protein
LNCMLYKVWKGWSWNETFLTKYLFTYLEEYSSISEDKEEFEI